MNCPDHNPHMLAFIEDDHPYEDDEGTEDNPVCPWLILTTQPSATPDTSQLHRSGGYCAIALRRAGDAKVALVGHHKSLATRCESQKKVSVIDLYGHVTKTSFTVRGKSAALDPYVCTVDSRYERLYSVDKDSCTSLRLTVLTQNSAGSIPIYKGGKTLAVTFPCSSGEGVFAMLYGAHRLTELVQLNTPACNRTRLSNVVSGPSCIMRDDNTLVDLAGPGFNIVDLRQVDRIAAGVSTGDFLPTSATFISEHIISYVHNGEEESAVDIRGRCNIYTVPLWGMSDSRTVMI